MSQAKKKQPLSDKERAFIEHYIVSWNGADAARKAGYDPNSARQAAYDLLTKPHIQKAIQERAETLFMTTEEWATRVTEQARASLVSFLDDQGEIEVSSQSENLHLLESYETEETFKKNEEGKFDKVIKKKVKLHSVQKALQMIGQRLGALESPLTKKLKESEIKNQQQQAQLAEIKIAQEENKEKFLDLIKRKAPADVYDLILEIIGSDEREDEAESQPAQG